MGGKDFVKNGKKEDEDMNVLREMEKAKVAKKAITNSRIPSAGNNMQKLLIVRRVRCFLAHSPM